MLDEDYDIDLPVVYPLMISMDLQLYTAAMLLTHSHSFFLNTCTINPDHWFPQMTIYCGNWMKCANVINMKSIKCTGVMTI